MRCACLLAVIACSSKSDPSPEVAPAKAPPSGDAAVAVDAAAPHEPIHALGRLELTPSFGGRLIGASKTALFVVDGDGSFLILKLDTGEKVKAYNPLELAALRRSRWTPGQSSKTGKPELEFDLAGRLDKVRQEADLVRTLMRKAGMTDTLAGVAISPDGATTIVEGGDHLYWLRDDPKPPVLLDVGPSTDAAVSPDGKRVAYDGCTSPCKTYSLRFVELAESMKPQIARVSEPSDIFWVADGSAVLAKSGACVQRVDAATLASTPIVCDAGIERVVPARAQDGVVVLVRAKAGRELRFYAADGKLVRTVALPSKLAGASTIATVAIARDGKALVSLAGPRASSETLLAGTDGTVKPIALPKGADNFASDAIWIDNDHAAALYHDTIYVLDAAALLR